MKNTYVARFAIVALTIGMLSPSINLQKINNSKIDAYQLNVSLLNVAEARQRNKNTNKNRNSNSNRNSNRNVNRNSNKNVNVNVNHNSGGRYYGGSSYNRNGAALVTGMIVGSAIASSNSSN